MMILLRPAGWLCFVITLLWLPVLIQHVNGAMALDVTKIVTYAQIGHLN